MNEIVITNNNFEKEVLESDRPVLLDFWASWCGPCRMLAPVVEEFANIHKEIKVGKINVDEEQELARKFQVMSIPTIVVMDKGKVIQQRVGFCDLETLERMF